MKCTSWTRSLRRPSVEIADTVIRLLDLAEMVGIELKDVIQLKLDDNATSGTLHGGKTV